MKFICLLWWWLPLQLWAHGADDHAGTAPQAAAAMAEGSRRAEASSELFELVLIAPAADSEQQQMDIYLDYFADNSPVPQASIELDIAGVSTTATMVKPGFYQLKTARLKAGRHSVTLTIDDGANLDLLTTVLDLTPKSPATQQEQGWRENRSQLWFSIGMVLLVLLAWRLVSARRQGE